MSVSSSVLPGAIAMKMLRDEPHISPVDSGKMVFNFLLGTYLYYYL